MNYFTDIPDISVNNYKLEKELWYNHTSGEKKLIERYINGYDKGLLKADSHDYWNEIVDNCTMVKKAIEKRRGYFYYNFHFLPENRSDYACFDYSKISQEPISLRTVFVSGFLYPQKKLKSISGGFYIHHGQSSSLPQILDRYNVQKNNPSILFNFGYYYTAILLNEKEYGYNKFRKNKNLLYETLDADCLPYLGASIWRDKNKLVSNPPLYNNTLITFSNDNEVLITPNFALSQGSLNISGHIIDWKSQNINNTQSNENIIIYTPYLNNNLISIKENVKDYYVNVGDKRINFLIITKGIGNNPKSFIVKIKKGNLLMPPMGIVVSLTEKYYNKYLANKFPKFDKEGYCNRPEIEVNFNFEIPNIKSGKINFAYSGFLPLMLDGKDFTHEPEGLGKIMFEQGFFHPFSRQSQETPIEKPYAREPRAVLVTTKDKNGNEYYGYFSFSGRYENSIGINLFEIVPMLKKIIHTEIINVIHLDSGSAVKLLYLMKNGNIKVLNLAALSMRSFTGEYDKNVYNLIHFSL